MNEPSQTVVSQEEFLHELSECRARVERYLRQRQETVSFAPEPLRRAVFAYLDRGGKWLRPAMLLLSCAAVGGSEEDALPAAAAVELFHTWTLVHDDVIDNDDRRRGGPSVHEQARCWALAEYRCAPARARDFGRDMAILAGDLQQAWAVSLLLAGAREGRIEPGLAISVVLDLETRVVRQLLDGEARDVAFSYRDAGAITESEILDMQRLKTGALFEFAARAGAAIGTGCDPGQGEPARALAAFAGHCGLAFQLQDDILGIVGDEAVLGKPVGSDVTEGKRTIILRHALASASGAERDMLLQVVGNRAAAPDQVRAAIRALVDLGGVDRAMALGAQCLEKARAALAAVPPSRARQLLGAWATFLETRTF